MSVKVKAKGILYSTLWSVIAFFVIEAFSPIMLLPITFAVFIWAGTFKKYLNIEGAQ